MSRLADHRGRLVNHVETLYQTGERELVVRFVETLRCNVVETQTARSVADVGAQADVMLVNDAL